MRKIALLVFIVMAFLLSTTSFAAEISQQAIDAAIQNGEATAMTGELISSGLTAEVAVTTRGDQVRKEALWRSLWLRQRGGLLRLY